MDFVFCIFYAKLKKLIGKIFCNKVNRYTIFPMYVYFRDVLVSDIEDLILHDSGSSHFFTIVT